MFAQPRSPKGALPSPHPWGPLFLALAGGIALVHLKQVGRESLLVWCLVSVLSYLGACGVQRYRASRQGSALVMAASLSLMASLGGWRYAQQAPRYKADHLLHHTEGVTAYIGVVTSATPRGKGTSRYITLCVEQVFEQGRWRKIEGVVEVSYPASLFFSPTYGVRLRIEGRPQRTGHAPRGNPLTGPYHYHRLKGDHQAQVIGYAPASGVQAYAYRWRAYLAAQLAQALPDPAAYGVLAALLLGWRTPLPSSTYQHYLESGTVHVLAVSGFHVTLLYGFLAALLGYCLAFLGLRRRRSWARGLAMLLLWGYALLSGGAPSVWRAVMMATLYFFSQLIKRPYQRVNALAFTAFVMVWKAPGQLFCPAFQLSYLAVGAIFYRWPQESKRRSTSRSRRHAFLQALLFPYLLQVALLPLTLYYFHYLPLYMGLTGWVVLLVMGLLLPLGILLLISSFCSPRIALGLGQVISQGLSGLHFFLEQANRLPYHWIGPFFPTPLHVAIYYLGLFTWLAWQASRAEQGASWR